MVSSFAIGRDRQPGRLLSNGLRAFALSISIAVFWAASSPAHSCAFDMVKPERTIIDWIVGSKRLVLARPYDDNPFTFAETQVLIGDDDGPPIDHLVDSVSRRKLAATPSDAVLFTHTFDGGWRRIAYVDDNFRNTVETAVAHRLSWQNNMPQSRLDFIVALQDSPLRTDKAVVIGELDKVPYEQLRKLDIRISDEELLKNLWTRSGYPYQAIRALLLGLAGTPSARAEIHDYINRAADSGGANNLGAFAAAFVEIEGTSGVEHLANTILHDPTQPLNRLEQIVMAMSVHYGIAGPHLKAAIQDALDVLVSQRSEAGAIVARQFSLRSDWSQTAVLEPLIRKRAVALGDLLTISVYVARANEATKAENGAKHE